MRKTEPFSIRSNLMSESSAALIETFDSSKRQQILDGARISFLSQGFDGASMNDIVKAAGVSKGTVYAYFPSKEKLFEALVYHDRRQQAEQTVHHLDDDRPMAEVLTELGLRMVDRMTSEDSIAQVRMVAAASAKFPEIGRAFFQAGPVFAISRIKTYFETKMAQGQMRSVDAEMAAMQFIDVISGCLHKPRLFNAQDLFTKRTPEQVVAAGVDLLLNGLGMESKR